MAVDIRQYEPIDTVVEAVEVNGLDLDDIVAWINRESKLKGIVGQTALRGRSAEYADLQTPEGMLRRPGRFAKQQRRDHARSRTVGTAGIPRIHPWGALQYIVTDGAGSFWKVSRSVFQRSYAPATVAAGNGGEGE
ncbi:hypothetical protein ACIBQ1_40780 [Nonomuraea sp. NPDC050153]|uniref:hypothetical protein n=1 Tax=Nonomuraea sp. NPDC050153 TaxID=3364359 RepID=UPI003798CFB5